MDVRGESSRAESGERGTHARRVPISIDWSGDGAVRPRGFAHRAFRLAGDAQRGIRRDRLQRRVPAVPCGRCRRFRHVCPRGRGEGRERDDSIQSLAARSRGRCRSARSRDRRPEHDSDGRRRDGRDATRTPTAFSGRSTIEASRWPAVARRFSAPADRHGRSPWRWRHGKRR